MIIYCTNLKNFGECDSFKAALENDHSKCYADDLICSQLKLGYLNLLHKFKTFLTISLLAI